MAASEQQTALCSGWSLKTFDWVYLGWMHSAGRVGIVELDSACLRCYRSQSAAPGRTACWSLRLQGFLTTAGSVCLVSTGDLRCSDLMCSGSSAAGPSSWIPGSTPCLDGIGFEEGGRTSVKLAVRSAPVAVSASGRGPSSHQSHALVSPGLSAFPSGVA